MTPYLAKFIAAVESAQSKTRADDLTDIEKVALCVSGGVPIDVGGPSGGMAGGLGWYSMKSRGPVAFVKDGSWRVIELDR